MRTLHGEGPEKADRSQDADEHRKAMAGENVCHEKCEHGGKAAESIANVVRKTAAGGAPRQRKYAREQGGDGALHGGDHQRQY